MTRSPWLALGLGAALAAGAALGVAAERAVVGRSLRPDPEGDEPFGTLRSPAIEVRADDGAVLHVEVDEPSRAVDDLTIIFSHGYCLTLDCWHYQRRDLRSLARLVFWDQRGHGRSTLGPVRYGADTIERLGRDLELVLDAVAPDGPVVLVGHSMGGMTVMALAGQRPDLFGTRVRGVALLGTSASGLGEVMLGLPAPAARIAHRLAPAAVSALARADSAQTLARDRANDLGLLLTRTYSFGSSVSPAVNAFTAEMLASTPLEVMADILPSFEQHDAVASLAAFHGVDGLVMVGTNDLLTPLSHSHEIVRHVPGVEFVELPDTGHMLMLERYPEVNVHLRSLVARVRASGSEVTTS